MSDKIILVTDALDELHQSVADRGLSHLWRRVAEPWMNADKPRLSKCAAAAMTISEPRHPSEEDTFTFYGCHD